MSSTDALSFTLTEALMLAGAAVMLALLIHGWWLARRARPRDVHPGNEAVRAEPGLGATAPNSSEALESVLDVLHEGDAAASTLGAHADTLPMVVRSGSAARKPSLRLDGLIDVLATLHLESPVRGEVALAHLPTTRRAGSKPFAIEGLNTNSGEWEPPMAGESYGEFQAGLQMANRSGALTEIEYSEWVQKVQTFADGIQAMAEFPDMLEAVAQGRELDQFASQHDAQMSFQLRAKGVAWTLGFVQQVAARQGMQSGGLPGRLVLPGAGENEPPLLWLQIDPQLAMAEEGQGVSLREVTLMFDVAQTSESLEPFGTLQDLARRLCRELEAELVDDTGRPLGPHAFLAIHEQLGTLYKALASRDLAAGSTAARRLFS
ncbi:cell division protein ZipA C-terminal FtsZ-binding domain-containing protein [Inhella sp.]|uniref:cell division protein ZipA C-terminal FtsZ-binding domain-containing protein n=1 Tax=Inhella sp. TaxID=1921806 RepID=UPI0035B2E347